MADDDNSNAVTNGDSIAAAAIFASLFAVLLIAHVGFLARYRAWFCIPFIVGATMEVTGFITRALGVSSPSSTPLKIVQVLCILLAPVLFAAAIYMTLSRIIITSTPHGYKRSLLRPRWITRIFVGGDVACFLVQAIGVGVVAAGGGETLGDSIVLAGLGLQIVVFGLFVAVAVRFHVCMRRQENSQKEAEAQGELQKLARRSAGGGRKARRAQQEEEEEEKKKKKKEWETHLMGLYVMSGFVTGRNAFRLVEYSDGYLMQHEWPLYVFDASMMLVVLSVGLRCYSLKTDKEDSDEVLRESLVDGYDMRRC